AGQAAAAGPTPAGATGTAALPHLLDLFLLLVGEDLRELIVGFLLQLVQLLLLLGGQFQLLLEEGRQNLAGLRRTAEPEPTGPTPAGAPRTTGTGPEAAGPARTTRAAPAGATGTSRAAVAAGAEIGFQFLRQRDQLLPGYDAVLVRVGLVE